MEHDGACRSIPIIFLLVDFRAGDFRRLLRGLERDAGPAHAADVGHQRDFLGDRRRRAARGRVEHGGASHRARRSRWCSASSR